MTARRARKDRLTAQEAASLEYMLDLLDKMERISAKHDFDFLSYLLSLPRVEIYDILNYSTPARLGVRSKAKIRPSQ